jgi:diaminopimelate decarboxylase
MVSKQSNVVVQDYKNHNVVLLINKAVKCNDSRLILQTLAGLGVGFDCASKVLNWNQ